MLRPTAIQVEAVCEYKILVDGSLTVEYKKITFQATYSLKFFVNFFNLRYGIL